MAGRSIIFFLIILLLLNFKGRSDEGMWIPLLLAEKNEAEMQAMGMKISAGDIYNINQSSLKDAIVIFGGGCTGDVVSDQGLILTNHHCGYGRIQSHSSVENDYLTYGFWAMDKSEELPNPGLTVTFLIRMEDVTGAVLAGVQENMTEFARREVINNHIDSIQEAAVKDTHYKALVKPFYQGNQYFLFVNEIFKDVRLVGAPPSNIGKFGGDTDNWMWPRHTGDFSVFRIYADKDNKPADYSEDNVPYVPKKHLSISLNGVDEGDFTFIFGYPGSTQQYIPSWGVDMQVNVVNPVRIDLRGRRIEIFKKAMDESREVRIQYAAKQAGISNGWKKAIGENRGINRLNTVEMKQQFETEFIRWVNTSNRWKDRYGNLLPAFEKTYHKLAPVMQSATYLQEAGMGIEFIRFARNFNKLVELSRNKESDEEEIQKLLDRLKSSTDSHFKNYQSFIDQKVFIEMMMVYLQGNDRKDIPEGLRAQLEKADWSAVKLADKVFEKSYFISEERVLSFLDNYKKSHYKKIEKDPAYALAESLYDHYFTYLRPAMAREGATLDSLNRIYMNAQMEMLPNKLFYPDANFTLRVAYGHVEGYQPDDAVNFNYFTTLDGIMEKEDPEIYDYVVEDKLKELYEKKDFGRYGDKDGTLHVCFIASNHTTGGNSGSPVLDENGYLIGINFDRCWEGTMSDIHYDITQCRNIALDIRYCLFIIDKFAGAGHLIDEMTIVDH